MADVFAERYAELRIFDNDEARKLPRLETVLDVAVAEHGIDVLPLLLADLVSPPPNALHKFFAHHLVAGGTHVTANFDNCIERAATEPVEVQHFHGVVGRWEQLGARLSVIEKGFPALVVDQLSEAIVRSELLVVVGYGGLDYFDVDPFWHEAATNGLLTGRAVLWIEHEQSGWREGEDPRRSHRQLDWFRCHADVQVVCAPTQAVVGELATAWGMPPLEDPPAWEERDYVGVGLEPAARTRATTRLLTFMGLHDLVRERLEGEPLDPVSHEWAAEAAWAAGQYRKSAEHWSAARPGDDAEDQAVKAERAAAAKWLRGQLRLARRELAVALEAAEQSEVSPMQRLVMAETLGRVLQHMSRLPDTWVLSTQRRRRRTLEYLESAEAALPEPLGIHMRARVDDIRGFLSGIKGERPRNEPVEDFTQADALLAMLNYRHGAIRERAKSEHVPCKDFNDLATDFGRLGIHGDAARVPLLPGAELCFSWREVHHGLRAVDFTRWHRVRLLAGWVVKRAMRRFRDRTG